LVGEAGIGKTQLLKQIAAEQSWGYHDYYAQLAQAEDIIGLPFRNPDNASTYLNLVDEMIWNATQEHERGILVFEEVNRATQTTASAVFAFMDKRGAGSFSLPEGWHIAIAQNPSGLDYSVNDLEKDHAFRRRVTWLAVREDVRAFLEHAEKENYHPHVLNYIKANPTHLLDANARAAGKAYANPAAWEKASLTLKVVENDAGGNLSPHIELLRVHLAGDLGVGVSDLFVEYVQDDSLILSPIEVIDNYSTKHSSIRHRVKRALEEGHVDKVSSLTSNLVRELYSSKPPPDKQLANNLGKFMLDLPQELRGSIMDELAKYADSDPNDYKYLNVLQKRLKLNDSFRTALTAQTQTIDKVKEELST
tara:strand:- start:10772 stop:11863 length:1092 start_codon:yes stop_codon:yes gene_type:complete